MVTWQVCSIFLNVFVERTTSEASSFRFESTGILAFQKEISTSHRSGPLRSKTTVPCWLLTNVKTEGMMLPRRRKGITNCSQLLNNFPFPSSLRTEGDRGRRSVLVSSSSSPQCGALQAPWRCRPIPRHGLSQHRSFLPFRPHAKTLLLLHSCTPPPTGTRPTGILRFCQFRHSIDRAST